MAFRLTHRPRTRASVSWLRSIPNSRFHLVVRHGGLAAWRLLLEPTPRRPHEAQAAGAPIALVDDQPAERWLPSSRRPAVAVALPSGSGHRVARDESELAVLAECGRSPVTGGAAARERSVRVASPQWPPAGSETGVSALLDQGLVSTRRAHAQRLSVGLNRHRSCRGRHQTHRPPDQADTRGPVRWRPISGGPIGRGPRCGARGCRAWPSRG